MVAVLIWAGVRLAVAAPAVIKSPAISLSPAALPLYAGLSLSRMLIAYAMSLAFTLAYGYIAAYNESAGQFMIPLLDVLQSVPILSFLPVVLLSFRAVLPEGVAAEVASIVLIFTSQVWNLTFAWYQSLKTIPRELREAADVYRFSPWMRLKTLELPFAAVALIWNSMMSWAGGWFFLMAAEIFTVGDRDFRLPGIGAYLSEAANRGNLVAVGWGIAVLLAMIVLLDQFAWRPLLAWSERFRLEMVGTQQQPSSWVFESWRRSGVIAAAVREVLGAAGRKLDSILSPAFSRLGEAPARASRWPMAALSLSIGGLLAYGAWRAVEMLAEVPASQWSAIGVGLAATAARVAAALLIALAWTVPAGVAVGRNPRLAAILQPVIQIAASVPATALFPVLLLAILNVPGGLNLAAVLLMLMGTQWYLLFNIIAGASAIPQDLKYTASLLGLSRWAQWRVLTLPALFPFIVTGLVTAAGGAWNASIVAEYTEFGGRTRSVGGIGATISAATARGDFPLLLSATLSMIFTVVLVNRLVWRRLYRLAEERFRIE